MCAADIAFAAEPRIQRKAEESGLVLMVHTGTSVFPGARNKYADPILCDDIAIDFLEHVGGNGATSKKAPASKAPAKKTTSPAKGVAATA